MTQDLLVNIGEEFFVREQLDSVELRVGLYNDSVDDLTAESNYDDITTEPTEGDNYAVIESTFTASNIDGNWGIQNDVEHEFDFSDTTDDSVEIDTAFVLANFDSIEAGTTDWHLIGNPSLSQNRKVGSIDLLDIGVGDLELKLD